ncbi:hypothetical protein PUNSTDRAFT_113463 [Punctularia strigosozonata HHB-11173 SS5]|uniref:uncharacterized protein n=1 Tax=Punctularia strigosozonata (strain HHB-11173) TaxID=741275 RepID=UPI0004417CC2|nr:uncharacterized protein PUNSTDRAFT_113463 [Punctularia strigosozonata HHB-11173 SS5]EIN08838.1 hypothetical protein PUNSTDRAFT_113463 [Punctularia strigosozonata HHB-11173 SS5]
MSSTLAVSWAALPAEMKLAVIDYLGLNEVNSLARVDSTTYTTCIPAMYKDLRLTSYESLRSFIANVPADRTRYTRRLSICTKSTNDERCFQGPFASSSSKTDSDEVPTRTDAVATLLARCPDLEELSLTLSKSLASRVVPQFARLHKLRRLCISNWGDEAQMPISERLVVSIALSVPSLTHLSLRRISRSSSYAPELVGTGVPVCAGDEGILAPADTRLALPSLLSLPRLVSLAVEDTHLGDEQWASAPVHGPLQRLRLGSCAHASPCENQSHLHAVLANPAIAHSVSISELTLSSPLAPEAVLGLVGGGQQRHQLPTAAVPASPAKPRLPSLKTVNLTQQFPLANLHPEEESPLQSTLTALSDSPLERLSIKCYEDDIDDCCEALEGVFSPAAVLAQYGIKEINVTAVPDEEEPISDDEDDDDALYTPTDDSTALRALQLSCSGIRLSGVVTASGFSRTIVA